MATDDWYVQDPTEKHMEDAKKEASKKTAPRFWMRENESKRIIILDDQPFGIYEHHIQLPGPNGKLQWGNHFTCRKGVDPENQMACPMCLSGNKRQFTAFVTIIDTTGWIDDKGNEHKYIRKLFPMTITSLERFKSRREKKSSLVGAVWDVSRTTKNGSRIGDDWDHVTETDPFTDKKLFYKSNLDNKMHPPEPYDYIKLFEPLSEAEMKALMATRYDGGSGGSDYEGGGKYEPPDDGGDNDAVY